MDLRIDEEPARRIVRDVRTANGFEDLFCVSDEEAAALERQRRPGVRRDVLERGRRDSDGYKASTAMAMPIPPPMQSDATP